MFSVKKVLKLFSFIVLITISVLIVYMGVFFGTIHIIASRNTVYAEKFNQKVFKAVAVGDDTTMVEWSFDMTYKGGQRSKMEQVAVQKWKDGKIIHERFYYSSN